MVVACTFCFAIMTSVYAGWELGKDHRVGCRRPLYAVLTYCNWVVSQAEVVCYGLQVTPLLACPPSQAADERYQQALAELKSSGKAADMRQQEMLRAEMALAYKTGDTAKAQRIYERLAPDEKK